MGLSLDPHKNHLLHHQHNQDHTQSQILISKHVVGEDDQNPSGKDQEFHNQYLQQVQNLHQHHQLLYSGGDIQINTQSSRQPPQPPKKRSYLPSSSSQRNEYASLPGKMGHQTTSTSRLTGLRNKGGGGEIVEVQGGHIIRSIGRKDRHSKVCTAKGPRDRRVRLSAHTAIEFYDVQDRLGYDRPSKAVDWLMNKAKAAIDELEELPAWKPRIDSISIEPTNSEHQEDQLQHQQHLHSIATRPSNEQLQQPNEHNNSSFLPSSVDTDSIADTIKSFFPTGASTETNNTQHHHNFQHTDLVSRISSQSQDLRLSLQSFQDPMLLHHHNHQNEQVYGAALFSGNPQMDSWNSGGDTGWSENPPGEMGRLHRMVSWNSGGDTGGGAFLFNLPQPVAQPMLPPLLFSQRGPLQSSTPPSLRAWIDPSAFSAVNDHQNQASLPFHPAGIGFASGFSGFSMPARIQGEEEEHDGVSNKPSSASSNSRH